MVERPEGDEIRRVLVDQLERTETMKREARYAVLPNHTPQRRRFDRGD